MKTCENYIFPSFPNNLQHQLSGHRPHRDASTSGFCMHAAPVYIAEIAPAEVRGTLVSAKATTFWFGNDGRCWYETN